MRDSSPGEQIQKQMAALATPPEPVRRKLEHFEAIAGRHPAASLTVAACIGVLLGWWTKRR